MTQRRGKRARRWWNAPATLIALSAIVIGGGFVAYQRTSIVANADIVETTSNESGGFMAIGMTESQPGFLLFSALEEKDVALDTEQATHFLAGTRTRLVVETPAQQWSKRLRKPVVITVDTDGSVHTSTVDWPLHTFETLADTADCEHESPVMEKHCDAPFLDVKTRIAKWPMDTVPTNLETFLATH